MKKLFSAIALIGALVVSGALFAGEPRTPDTDEMVLDVDGVVCSFCSYGLQKKLKKMDYVDASRFKQGVHVDIDNQQVTLALKEGVAVDIQAAFDAIREGGYRPIAASLLNGKGEVVRTEASNENEEDA